MATLQDILTRVPALLDDASTSVFTPAFILPYVNSAQEKISTYLVSRSVKQAKFRQNTAMVIPAGTKRLGRYRNLEAQVAPNLIAKSENFSTTTGDWTTGYDAPTVATGQADPDGGTAASKWTFAAATVHDMRISAATTATGSGQNASACIWLKTSGGVPYTVTVALSLGTGSVTQTVNVTSVWQKIVVNVGPVDLAAPVMSTMTITFPVKAGLVCEVAFPTITYTQEYLGYSMTNGLPLTATYPPILPDNFIEPDELWEAKIGGTDQDFYRVVGPYQIPNQAQTSNLGYWDFYEGEIKFLGATEDRLLRIDYWGALENFEGASTPAQAVVMQGFVNPISFMVCKLISHSRGQHEAAAEWGKLYEDELEDITNTQQKAQQQNPVRRISARGFSRYQGYFRGVG